jgi:hypothetical protein
MKAGEVEEGSKAVLQSTLFSKSLFFILKISGATGGLEPEGQILFVLSIGRG